MNTDAIQAGSAWLILPANSLTPQGIDAYTTYLSTFITNLANQTVPLSTPSHHGNPWWSLEVSQAICTEQLAQRDWTALHSLEAWNALTDA